MESWEELSPPLSLETLSALKSEGFIKPVAVQAATIPKFLSNKDVAVQAETGSGKTLAFVIPIVEILKRRKEPWKLGETGAVVVLPTRELAVQVAEVLRAFLPSLHTLRLLIGGTDVAMDTRLINTEGATVVVATPGRLADLLERKACHLAAFVKSVEVLVLDEADRLLDLGFQPVINTVLEYLPKQRRTGLFSATLTHEVGDLIRAGLRNPVTISLSSDKDLETSTPETLNNFYMECSASSKLSNLVDFLSGHKSEKVIVFLATCASVAYFSTVVQRLISGLVVLALHGKMKHKRQKLFNRFFEIKSGVLMCTDVMARGIDIPDVDWVVQFDPPSSAKSFIHRCGRTARMGRHGNALVFLLSSETAYIQYMEISQHVTLVPVKETPGGKDRERVDTNSVVERTMELLCNERELYNASIKAFVSFVRFYHKHELQLIFSLKALDLPVLARGTFALLHLPKMPELKGRDLSSFVPYPVAVEDIPFASKTCERHTKASQLRKEAIWKMKFQHRKSKWRKKEREERRLARKSRRQKSKFQFSVNELEEFARDARLLKKYKARKISKETLNDLIDKDSSIL